MNAASLPVHSFEYPLKNKNGAVAPAQSSSLAEYAANDMPTQSKQLAANAKAPAARGVNGASSLKMAATALPKLNDLEQVIQSSQTANGLRKINRFRNKKIADDDIGE